MLERVWRKGNALALFVGMLIDIVTMEDVWRFLKKLGIKPKINKWGLTKHKGFYTANETTNKVKRQS